jgi:hypothetical protein
MFDDNIQEVGRRQGWNIITGRSPKGKFYFLDLHDYIAIDNTGHELRKESFKTKEECLNWLKGENNAK